MYREKSRSLPYSWGSNASTGHYCTGAMLNATSQITASELLARYQAYPACPAAVQAYAAPAISGTEKIEWSSLGRKANNSCFHFRSTSINRAFNWSTPYWDRWHWMFYSTYYYREAPFAYNPYQYSDVGHLSWDYQAARSRAWHEMQPRFEGRIGMLNFLFELKDFRDMVRHVFKYESTIKNLRKISNAWAGKPRDLKPMEPFLALAQGDLIMQFAIKPLMRDLADIFQQINIVVSEAQQTFQDAGAELQSSHYSEYIAESGSWIRRTRGMLALSDGEGYTSKFTATLRYKYSYSMRDIFQAWMKYWGISGSFEAWWNMIPGSFLADYFVQIGNSIRAMEHDPNVELTEYDYCESIKTQFLKGTILNGDASSYAVVEGKILEPGKTTLVNGLDATIYRRLPAVPYLGPATPKFKLPSGQQSLNMAALLRCLL